MPCGLRSRTAYALFPFLSFPLCLAVAQEKPPLFTEITDEVGLSFSHEPGAEGRFQPQEVMGSGGGFLDYDGNGELDIYLIQAGPLPGSQSSEQLLNQLFRQDPDGSFTDVTSESGLGDTGYGTGLAVGDIDNDGLLDLYVTNDGPDALYHNQGGGMFRNVTQQAGITGNFWSASAAFCDYDNDGFLDLYVTRYVRFDPSKQCTSSDGSPDYCSPQSYGYESDVLYRNEGTGSFTDVSRTAGLHGVEAPGLGVVCADFNLDGLMDFYVSNDGEANQLWENQGRGKFIDQAFFNGSAMNEFGQAEAGMGIGLGDADGDGDLDLFLTHLTGQTNTSIGTRVQWVSKTCPRPWGSE